MSIRHGVDNGADAGLTDGDAPDPAPATPKKRRSTTYPESFTPHVEGVDYGILDTLLGYAIRRSQIRVYSDFYREIGDQQITPQRFAVLSIIGANPGLQQTQIAEIMGVARPGATSLIDFWETRGCVERRADPNDRRSYGIHVTPDGAGTLRSLQDKVKRHDDAIARCLSAEELDALMALLEKFYSAPPTK